MKKRSLLAAVAMLIVSAILLTSSTYAWFAARHEATVAKAVATVSGADAGNVQVSMDSSSGWTTELTLDNILGNGVSSKALNPVDINPFVAGGMEDIDTVDFDTTNYTVKAGATTDMLNYTWYVRAVNRGSNTKIEIPVAFSAGSCLYGVIYIDDTLVTNSGAVRLWGPGGNDSYVELGEVTAAVEGGSTNKGIIDSTNDTITGTLGSTVTANTAVTGVTLSVDISSDVTSGYGSAHKIQVVVWAEGQDANCVGGVSVTDGGFTFGVKDTTNGGIHLAA